MRNITLRPGESFQIGDTTVTVPPSAREFGGLCMRSFLTDLLDAGVQQVDIARRLGVSRASISAALKPSDKPWMPSYANGLALVAMHGEVCEGQGAPHA